MFGGDGGGCNACNCVSGRGSQVPRGFHSPSWGPWACRPRRRSEPAKLRGRSRWHGEWPSLRRGRGGRRANGWASVKPKDCRFYTGLRGFCGRVKVSPGPPPAAAMTWPPARSAGNSLVRCRRHSYVPHGTVDATTPNKSRGPNGWPRPPRTQGPRASACPGVPHARPVRSAPVTPRGEPSAAFQLLRCEGFTR
jgi:hypothetical protein